MSALHHVPPDGVYVVNRLSENAHGLGATTCFILCLNPKHACVFTH